MSLNKNNNISDGDKFSLSKIDFINLNNIIRILGIWFLSYLAINLYKDLNEISPENSNLTIEKVNIEDVNKQNNSNNNESNITKKHI